MFGEDGTKGTNVTKLLYNEIQPDAVNARASGPLIESRRLAPSRFADNK